MNKIEYDLIIVENQVIGTWGSYYSLYFCNMFKIFHNKRFKNIKNEMFFKTI